MSVTSRSRRRGLGIIVALAALFVAAPAAQADVVYGGPPIPNKGTYLALGDSLAFGYQAVKVGACAPTGCANPDAIFSTGYVNQFQGLFSGAYPGVKIVNLGCPGETSSTLINATNGSTGCTTYPFPIHVNHPNKTQLQAAVQVLREQGKKVNPVTLDIGANDVLALKNSCTTGGVINLLCIQAGAPAVFATVQANLDQTLNTLRAEGGKLKEILVVGLYNPLYLPILQANGPAAAAGTDALANQLNALMASTTAKYHAKFVDPMPVFNPGSGSNPPAEVNALCTYTLMCTPQQDIHASDAGYAQIAGLLETASGY